MRYRIKKVTYGNGKAEFTPQRKTFWGWKDFYDVIGAGMISYRISKTFSTFEEAKKEIRDELMSKYDNKKVSKDYVYMAFDNPEITRNEYNDGLSKSNTEVVI